MSTSASTLTSLKYDSPGDEDFTKLLEGLVFTELANLSLWVESIQEFPCAAPRLSYLIVKSDNKFSIDNLRAFVSRFPTIKRFRMIYGLLFEDYASPDSLTRLGSSVFACMDNLEEFCVQNYYVYGSPYKWEDSEKQVLLEGWSTHCKSLKYVYFHNSPWMRGDGGWFRTTPELYGGELSGAATCYDYEENMAHVS
ncbi:hypothetical protein NM688_g8740 [Phlebia brevispora]|uniref:Uncharacterized protein n=1 Tax=Phlebia brevispora TaxID=194682 RepID=A0ACC1RNH3_9APHY|nr:hypothetical protein NM688_g8740 [Phlebia brevispora]